MTNSNINVNDVKAQFEAIYAGQGFKDIVQSVLRFEGKMEQICQKEITDQILVRGMTLDGDAYITPYKHQYMNKGSIVSKPIETKLYHVAQEFSFIPNEYKGTWADFVKTNGGTAATHPYTQYIIENVFLKSKTDNFAQFEIYKGVRLEAVEDVISLKGKATNGMGKAITDYVTAGIIVPYVTGALSADPIIFVGQVENFVKNAVPSQLTTVTGSLTKLMMRRPNYLKFRAGMNAKYNSLYPQVAKEDLNTVFETEVQVDFFHEMEGSDRLIITTPENPTIYSNFTYDSNPFEMQVEKRYVHLLGDYFVGFGFKNPYKVWVNDQN